MNKYLHRLLILLIFISIASAAYIFSGPKNNNTSPPLPSLTSTTQSSTPEKLVPTHLENNPDNSSKKTKIDNRNTENKAPAPPIVPENTNQVNPPIPAQNQTQTLPVTFIIDNKEYRLTVAPETTAYDTIVQLQESNQISFSSKKFSGLGYFIEAINGIKNSPSTGFYWTLYINNQEAKVGASNYTLKSNDIINWKYMRK